MNFDDEKNMSIFPTIKGALKTDPNVTPNSLIKKQNSAESKIRTSINTSGNNVTDPNVYKLIMLR